MSNIKNVVFDFGGVLVDWNPHHLYDKYFGSAEKATWFLENICRYSWNLQMDKGKPFAEGVAELQAIYPEWSEAIAIYHTRWIEMMGGEVDGTPDLLRRLKAAGYRVFGLSNWSMETFPLVRDEFPIFKELEGKVISGEELMVKPEPEICAADSLFCHWGKRRNTGAFRLGDRCKCGRIGQCTRKLLCQFLLCGVGTYP